ncbi:conserved hypothetical protein [Methanocaldococcus infernus ME]|uniref:Uncharacterized protein n=1 Tax=Methanocaldococcus infernus (strain DSM 11812 / JCM 15783 / ME) TaxID=573063 RepID=D5VRZ4_METIM|nr:hypothetical protein [Methanocaldococcus infernus]ADG13347.1 conserved hypothetical protein [Methanocaldococcus infernus ME]
MLVIKKLGNVKSLKEIVDELIDFTGVIEVDKYLLIYRNSKLIKVIDETGEKDLLYVIKELKSKDSFYIKVFELEKDLSNLSYNKILEYLNHLEVGDYIILNSYSNLLSLDGFFEIVPKRFKDEKGYVGVKDKNIIFCVYKTKRKLYFKEKALTKIKTLFAVSLVYAKKISDEIVNEYKEGKLYNVLSFEELIKNIEKREFKTFYGPLSEALTEEPSLIKIDEGYIVSRAKKPIYAFYKEYDGNKAYRYLKNLCIVNDIEFKIYPITEEEYKNFSLFSKNRVKL